MKEYTRNIIVGLTVLTGLAVLAVMILLFAGMPSLFRGGYTLRMSFPTTAEVREGDPVHLAGIQIGEVLSIGFADNDPRRGVCMTARIDAGVRVPGNVNAYIYNRGLAGGAYVELKSDGEYRVDARTGRAMQFLPRDYAEPIQGYVRTGLVPDEFTQAMGSVARLAETIDKLIAPAGPAVEPASQPATGAATAPAGEAAPNLRTILQRLNGALAGMEDTFGDPENRKNLKTALANLAKASEQTAAAMDSIKTFAAEATKTAQAGQKTVAAATTTIARTGEGIDRIALKLVEDADKLGTLLTTLNNVARKLEKGEGSAGKVLNDPELYNSLLGAARELNTLLKELQGLAREWKEKGMGVKLK